MGIFNFIKSKKKCLNTKTLVIVLAVLVVLGFALAIYFDIKIATLKKEFSEIGPQEKLEKIYSYAVALEKLEEFRRTEGKGDATAALERAVLATHSGVLKNLFDEMIYGGTT